MSLWLMGMREDDRTSPKNSMIQMDLKTVRIVWETQDNVGEIVVLTRLRRIALVMGRDVRVGADRLLLMPVTVNCRGPYSETVEQREPACLWRVETADRYWRTEP